MRRGGLLSDDAQKILFAERMHWTLEYIREMDAADYLNTVRVIDGLDTARAHERIRGR